MKLFNVLIFIWFFVSCSNHNKDPMLNNDLQLGSEFYCKIDQSKIKFQGIKYFDSNHDIIAFVTYNPNKAFIKSLKNDSVKELKTDKKIGLEYPSLIKIYDSKIYIWDSDKLKFFIFNSDGVFIRTLEPIDRGIKDFVLHNGKSYFLLSGGHNKLFAIYNLESEQIESEYVKPTNEHYVIETNTKSGFIRQINHNIFFPDYGRKGFYKYSLSDRNIQFISLDLPNYKIKNVKNHYNLISNKRKLIHYLSNNSTYYDLINFKKYLGLIATNDILSKKNNYKRGKTIYLFDTIDFKKRAIIEVNKNDHKLLSIGDISDRKFYFVNKKQDSTKMHFDYSIHKLLIKHDAH